MRLLNSISRSASFRRLISPRKNSRCGDDFPLLKPVEESNVAHFDTSEDTFSLPNRTSSETCSEDTISIASNGKQQESMTWSPCKTPTPELGTETTFSSEESLSCPSPNKSISNNANSSSTSEEKLVVSVDSSENPEAHSPRRKSSRRSPRKAASLSRSSATCLGNLESNPQEKSVESVETLPTPKTRSLRRLPSRRFSPRKTTVRPKHSSENGAAAKKTPSFSSSDMGMSTGKQESSDLSIEASVKLITCSSVPDTGVASVANSKKDPTLSIEKESTSSNPSNLKSKMESYVTPKARSHLSKSAHSFQRTTTSRHDSSSEKEFGTKKAKGTLSSEEKLSKKETSSWSDPKKQSLTLTSGKGEAHTDTPRRIATRRVISSFEDTKTNHTSPFPVKKTPVRGLQRCNSTMSFLQSPSESLEVLSSRQPTPFHTPATAKYSSKHKNGISLGDMLNSYHRITSSVTSQSSTFAEGDEECCDENSTFASFAQEEEDKLAPELEQRPPTPPIKSKSIPNTTDKPEPMQQQMSQAKLMKSTPKVQVQPQMTHNEFMDSTSADPYIESPPKKVQKLPSKLPFNSPPKKPQAPRGAPPAAIGRPQLHRHASTTALLKGSKPKSRSKPAKTRRPSLHRQGSLMADNLQDFFSQYDDIYKNVVEDDSLAGW